MMLLVVKLVVRVLVFGVAFAFITRRTRDVRVEPRSAIPVVALVFALLNTALYWLISPLVTLASLGLLWFLAPFVANLVLLYLTDRLARPLKIQTFTALLYASAVLTLAHLLLRVVRL